MSQPTVFALSSLAGYQCRHSGACCTAGWSIPVEPHAQALVGGSWLLPDDTGACPQYDRPSGLCRVQRDHGEPMLPESCHHFPRRALLDDRGVSVALSLYCPTAAALLLDDTAPLTIVRHPPAFPLTRNYDGLDARGEWPPLLRPDVLFDVESYAAWERYLVETLASSPLSLDDTLGTIATTAETLRAWRADAGTLEAWTEAHVTAAPRIDLSIPALYSAYSGNTAFARVAATVPSGLEAPVCPVDVDDAWNRFVAPVWPDWTPAALRYVATKGFASWTAYQGRGVRAQVAELYVAAAVLRVEIARACAARQATLNRDAMLEAVRSSDLLLVHLADRDALVAWLKEADVDARS